MSDPLPTDLIQAEWLAGLSRRWALNIVRLRPELPLAGSPERTAWRSVVETDDGRLFVLEKIPSRLYGRKRQIIVTLRRLAERGLTHIVPYRADAGGDAIVLFDHGLWQLCPFVTGIDLDRPAYLKDAWRGEAVAGFLVALHAIGAADTLAAGSPFSIVEYSRDLFGALQRRQPVIAERYRPFMDHLEGHFFPVCADLPGAFCHGDVHPINIIWGRRSIRAVIDWEFCGIKTEMYDLANLLGCLGVEDPQLLDGPFARHLVRQMKKSGIYAPKSWTALPDLMLAIRFAWLSEWLRKDDRPMIGLEADYMSFLLAQRSTLIDRWMQIRAGC